MKRHVRHLIIAVILALVLLIVAAVSARAFQANARAAGQAVHAIA